MKMHKLVIAVATVAVTAMVTVGLSSSPAGADASMTIGLWEMNEPAGARTLIDSSGNGLNGTIGTEVTTGATFGGATGHRFAYLAPNTPPAHPQHLDTVPHSSLLNPGTGDFAVTVKMRTTNRFGNIVQKGQSGNPGGYFKFENPNGIVTCLYRGPLGSNLVSSLRNLNDGQWHTIRCERTQYYVTMTVDGVVTQRLKGVTGNISNTWPLSIAGKVSCDQVSVTCDYFVGDIDYVRLEGPGVPNPDVTPPSAPGKPTATSTVSGQAAVSFAAATDDRATSLTYSVYRDAGTTPIRTITAGTTGTISFTDTGLVPGATHTWRVRASDGTNTGPYSPSSDPVTILGGADPMVLAETDFTAALAGWTGVSNLTVDSAVGSPTDEAPSLRAAPSNQVATGRLTLSSTSNAVCAAADVRVTSVSSAANYSLLKLRNTGASSIGRIWINSSGALRLRADVTGAEFTTGAVVAPGTWHRLGLCATVGAAGSLSLTVDGTTVGSWTANTGTTPIATVQLGDNEARTATVHWDALVVTAP